MSKFPYLAGYTRFGPKHRIYERNAYTQSEVARLLLLAPGTLEPIPEDIPEIEPGTPGVIVEFGALISVDEETGTFVARLTDPTIEAFNASALISAIEPLATPTE